MPAIRVLIVDDSVVIRRVLSDVLSSDPGVEVAGSAADGSIALSKIALLKPDLITLDIEMPGMSGVETLREIRKKYPTLPVIMFSTLTERGGAFTLEALALGASDYVTKPSNTGSLDQTRARIQQELIPRVKGLCRRLVSKPVSSDGLTVSKDIAKNIVHRPLTNPARVDVVAIGTSTGGPNALAAVLPFFPQDFPVPIVVVVSYADFITLLFAFFVVLYSSSQIDKRRVGRLAMAIQVAFQELGVFDTSNTRIPLSETEAVPFSQIQAVENAERTGDLARAVQPMKGMLAPANSSAPLKDVSGGTRKSSGPRNSQACGRGQGAQGRLNRQPSRNGFLREWFCDNAPLCYGSDRSTRSCFDSPGRGHAHRGPHGQRAHPQRVLSIQLGTLHRPSNGTGETFHLSIPC
jgi:CheY-like chemotaxis protein